MAILHKTNISHTIESHLLSQYMVGDDLIREPRIKGNSLLLDYTGAHKIYINWDAMEEVFGIDSIEFFSEDYSKLFELIGDNYIGGDFKKHNPFTFINHTQNSITISYLTDFKETKGPIKTKLYNHEDLYIGINHLELEIDKFNYCSSRYKKGEVGYSLGNFYSPVKPEKLLWEFPINTRSKKKMADLLKPDLLYYINFNEFCLLFIKKPKKLNYKFFGGYSRLDILEWVNVQTNCDMVKEDIYIKNFKF